MKTFLLDQNWDWTLDAGGNIALASDPYSQAQDAASQCRLVLGELYYDTTQGIPYFTQVLGHMPPMNVVKSFLEGAALLVPGVASAAVFFDTFDKKTRKLSGQVQITNTKGQPATASFTTAGF